jgi:ADP-heptose:LPS heptosyltransferase
MLGHRMSDLQSAKKILLVAPHRLGDSIFATPGIRVLRQAKPDVEMDVVALSTLSYELFQHNSCVNNVFQAALLNNNAAKAASKPVIASAIARSNQDTGIEKLAANYDIVMPLQNIKKIQEFLRDVKNVLILPRYTGSFHYSENFYRFVCQQLPEAAQFNLGPYELNFSGQDKQYADSLLKNIPADSFILALHMGCHRVAKEGNNFLYKLFPFLLTKDSRSWSFKKFDELIQQLLNQYPKLYVVLTGTESEKFAADSLKKNPRIVNAIGKTNVTQLAALLTRCQLLLTGDTGPLHVASAVGTSIVMLCGMTDPAQTGPYPADKHKIIQKDGMDKIQVKEVSDAVASFI